MDAHYKHLLTPEEWKEVQRRTWDPNGTMKLIDIKETYWRTERSLFVDDIVFKRVQDYNGEPDIAGQLFEIAGNESPAAARAMRGTTSKSHRELIRKYVRRYLDEERFCTVMNGDVNREYCQQAFLPLALGAGNEEGPPTDEERKLLLRALRFKPQRRPARPIDTSFRLAAVDSLGTLVDLEADAALLRVLLDSRDDERVRDGCLRILHNHIHPEILRPYQWVSVTKKKSALRRLAWEEVGWLRFPLTSLKRFERVRNDLVALLEKVPKPKVFKYPPAPPAEEPRNPFASPPSDGDREKQRQSPPIPEPRDRQLYQGTAKAADDQSSPDKAFSPTSPTKATAVPSAPPPSGRQARGERPKTGSDEGDHRDELHVPAPRYCRDCMEELAAEGLLPSASLDAPNAAEKCDCVRCRLLGR